MPIDQGRESLDAPSTPKASIENPTTPTRLNPDVPPPAQDPDMRAKLDRVLQSNIGINTLLTRLKQSISSAREFSSFLKERASLEERHFHGIQRLTRGTQEQLGRPDNRQGSFAYNYRELGMIHERMAKNGEEFAHNLMAMSDELQDIAAHCERGRKQCKHTGLEAEQRSQDAESSMEKAKQKYFMMAEQYDRVRTGERQSGKFGIKGPKSAAQHEESLLSKAENADSEYRSRVEAAQSQRHELLTSSRPQAIKELQSLIMECDAAVSMQLQKFAVLNEKLLLGNGLCVSPLKNQENGAATGLRSLREVASAVNNQKDFEDFVLTHSGNVGPTPAEIRYEKHPALTPPAQHSVSQASGFNQPMRTDTGQGSVSGPYNRGGQTSGTIPNQPPLQSNQQYSGTPNQYPGPTNQYSGSPSQYTGPQHQYQSSLSSKPSNAPQLPQIDALSSGNPSTFDTGAAGSPQGRGYNDPRGRDTAAPVQPNQGQLPSSGPPRYSSDSPVNQQVIGNIRPTGPSQDNNAARGPPSTSNVVPVGGAPNQGPHHPGSRGPSLGQSTDFRPDGRPTQSPTSYQTQQPSGRGQQGPGQSPTYQSQPPIGRGQQGPGQSPTYQTQQPTGRGQQGPSYPPTQQEPRGMPNQTNNYPSTGRGGPAPNIGAVRGPAETGRGPSGRPSLPPLRPVFGVPLDELFRRDGSAVPGIVYQCVQAVDLFGLNSEGVYRVPGSAQHIMELQALFDHDSSLVDFRNPAAFHHDIASVTTLLKHFLRDLPDPLLTSQQYNSFIQAAKIEEDIVRRDSLHAIINSLPDPNYATLRTLVLHLHRVANNSAQNRMTASNLAIVFGPTLMGGHGGGPSGEIQDAGWQARVVETILNNTLQIFDDDD